MKTACKLLLIIALTFIAFSAGAQVASFTADHHSGCSPLIVNFTNTSTGATSYHWDLGDATTSPLTNVSRTYTSPGTYIISLTAYGSGSSIAYDTITVYPKPSVTFTGGPNSICPGSSVSFTSTVVPGVPGSPTYVWNFGDGSTGVGASPVHIYNTPYGYKNVTLTVTNGAGCDSTVTITSYINVYTPAVLAFSTSVTTFCHGPANITFTNTSTGYGTVNYSWNFGDGGAGSTSYSPTHTYAASGTYTVRLIATDGHGCSDTLLHTITVSIGVLAASFSHSTATCISSPIAFLNTSTAHTFSSWTFGDGSISYIDNPTHTYAAVGTYPVTLVISDGLCYDTATHTVIVHSLPVVDFTFPASPCPAPVPVTLIGAIPAGATVTWNFGDGGAGGAGTPVTHLYTDDGDMIPVMTATDTNGCVNIVSHTLHIYDCTLDANLPALICLNSSYNYNYTLTTYFYSFTPFPYPYGSTVVWNFGDGTTSTSATPTHAYTSVGTFTATCTVTTTNGCVFVSTQNIVVTNDVPTATFTATPDTVCYGHPVLFTATLTHGPIDDYHWFFHDDPPNYFGTSTTHDTITHIFNYPGVFTVTLDPEHAGCASSTTHTIVVDSPKAIIGIKYNCINYLSPLFIDSSMGDDSHQWIFPGGITSAGDTVTHTFSGFGTYTVTLVTHNSHSGCTDTATRQITLFGAIPQFTVSDTTICAGTSAVFSFILDTENHVATYNFFSHEGGGSSNTFGVGSIEHYPTAGIYTEGIGTTDRHGCTRTITQHIYVSDPTAHFHTAPYCGGVPDPFFDSSTHQAYTTLDSFAWTFGDGGTAVVTTPNTTHSYATHGTYVIREIVTDNFGCKDTAYGVTHIWHPDGTLNITPYPCKNIPSHFHFASYDSIVSAHWTFGDGGTSASDSPTHTYIDTGIYHIRLVVTDVHGCTDTTIDTVHITVPHAAFVCDTFLVCNPYKDTFINNSTGATSYLWTFGDGNSSVVISPKNTYLSPGIDSARLIAYTATGCPDTAFRRIHVFGFSGDFAYPDSGCGPLSVHFNAGLINVDSIKWDYGDGILTGPLLVDTITHIYNVVGSHTPILTVYKNGCGSPSTGSNPIKVDTVYPGFTESPQWACPNTPITFTDTSHSLFSILTGWHWSFGDGVSSAANPATHGFSTSGSHIITFTGTDGWGCSSSMADSIHIFTLPHIPAVMGDSVLCIGSTTVLHDSLAGGTWTSGDGSIAGINNVTGAVTTIDTGHVTFYYHITDSNGCVSSVGFNMYIASPPFLDAIFIDSVCLHDSVLISTITPGGTWSSSDSTIATINAGGYIIGVSSGTVILTYSVTNSFGCTGSASNYFSVIPTVPLQPITGVMGVCSGDSTQLSHIIPGGTWESSDPSTAAVDPVTGLVTGYATGTVTISYTASNICGVFTVTTNVAVNLQPYITTNMSVGCHSLIPDTVTETGGTVTFIPDTCINVCDSTTIRYYANGVAGSNFTWTVMGGTIVTDYGDSVDVFWPTAGTIGSISLTDTFSHCSGQASACVKVIQRPHALFSASAQFVCLGNEVFFTDLSTGDAASPIVSWNWNFGDGGISAVENPSYSFSDPGDNLVTLVVRNACGCTDTIRMHIKVDENSGPSIYCPSLLCEKNIATYNTDPDSCDSYDWSVVGGVITSGAGTNTITVEWGAGDATGFGYVNLTEPCDGVCSDTVTIKVPIIQLNAPIDGPTYICTNQQYEYTLPLWPATQYHWGVIDAPYSILGYRDDHTVVVRFTTPGTYTLHGWYQNRIKLCGGNVDKTIIVTPSVSINGPVSLCQGTTEGYSLLPGTPSADWTLIDPIGATGTYTGTTSYWDFPIPGQYTLTATGDFCATPLTVIATGIPPAIDSVHGPDTVCRNRVYVYKAFNDIPGTLYEWHIIGGTVTPSSGSSTVNVVWTSSGTKSLYVDRISVLPPFCHGGATYFPIIDEVIDPQITGDTLPCANSLQNYATAYTRGEQYDWKIFPDSTGSVISGNHTPHISVQWNNLAAATNAMIILSVHKCDSVVTDSLQLIVQPSPAMAITCSNSPACPGAPVTFFATPGDSIYIWHFGDGTSATTNVPFVIHHFPHNTTSSNAYYTVEVSGIPSVLPGCIPVGAGSYYMAILPGPLAYASTASLPFPCVGVLVTIVGTATGNVGDIAYQWFNSGSTLGGETDTTLVTASDGGFNFVASASNGCSDTSNIVNISHFPCPSGSDGLVDTATGGDGSSPSCGGALATTSHSCTTIHLMGDPSGGAGQWLTQVTPPAGPLPPGITVDVVYDKPGIYWFTYVENLGSCTGSKDIMDTIGVVPSFLYGLRCGGGSLDTLTLYDHSSRLPFFTIDTVQWQEGSILLGYGTTLSVALMAPGTHTITQTVMGMSVDGHFSCQSTQTITMPGRPHAAFTDMASPMCTGVPIQFIPTLTAGITGFSWAFGDSSYSLLQNPQRAYTWKAPINPNNDTVKLTVTDSIGCSADTTLIVQIEDNLLNGSLGPNVVVCPENVPVTLLYIPYPFTPAPSSYLWNNGATTSSIDVSQSGTYWVTIYGNYQCQQTVPISPHPALQVTVLQTPTAQIYGQQHYCLNNPIVNLSGYAGDGVTYQWYVDGSASVTTPTISIGTLGVGDHTFQLVITVTDAASGVTCPDTSAIFLVHMHDVPPAPVITGPVVVDCDNYLLTLSATDAVTGIFNWSDGTNGAVDSIYTGGPYMVTFTDVNGCVSNKDTTVPMSPEYYFQYFPTGCYSICDQQMPLTIPGVPDITFTNWAWLQDNSPVSSGANSVMGSYAIDSDGVYQWALDNGLCAQTSDEMDVTTIRCDKCKTQVSTSVTCSASPACYTISFNITNPYGTTVM